LAIPLSSAGRNVACGFPLVDTRSHELGHSYLRGLDVIAVPNQCDQLGLLCLRLTLRALEAMPLALALAGLRIAHVNNNGPPAGRPFSNVAFHCPPPSSSSAILNLFRIS